MLNSLPCNTSATWAALRIHARMQESTQDKKIVRLNATQEALLCAIASGAPDDAVLDEFFAAGKDYMNNGYPSGSNSSVLEPMAGRVEPS